MSERAGDYGAVPPAQPAGTVEDAVIIPLSSYRIPSSTWELARDIDYDFQDMADQLGLEAKTGPAGIPTLLAEARGIGSLECMYLGEILGKRLLRLTVRAEGYDGQLGFFKEYELRNYHLVAGGQPHQRSRTAAEDFGDCPGSLAILAGTIRVMRDEALGLAGTLE